MLPWGRSPLSYLITPRFSPACTGSVAVAALPVHDKAKACTATVTLDRLRHPDTRSAKISVVCVRAGWVLCEV